MHLKTLLRASPVAKPSSTPAHPRQPHALISSNYNDLVHVKNLGLPLTRFCCLLDHHFDFFFFLSLSYKPTSRSDISVGPYICFSLAPGPSANILKQRVLDSQAKRRNQHGEAEGQKLDTTAYEFIGDAYKHQQCTRENQTASAQSKDRVVSRAD
jgi:hypothetical protein